MTSFAWREPAGLPPEPTYQKPLSFKTIMDEMTAGNPLKNVLSLLGQGLRGRGFPDLSRDPLRRTEYRLLLYLGDLLKIHVLPHRTAGNGRTFRQQRQKKSKEKRQYLHRAEIKRYKDTNSQAN